MIYSDKQYAITEGELRKLRSTLAVAQSQSVDTAGEQNWLLDVQIDAIKSQISTLEADLSHYALLKSGEITFAKAHSLQSLPSVLVQARIAAGMSQTDLAERLGMKAQQIQLRGVRVFRGQP
jgi:HTH-type transcriptional regulator / antitoxin HigA